MRLTYGRNTAVYTVMYCIVSVRSLVFVQCTRIRWWYQWPHFTAVFTAVILLATLGSTSPVIGGAFEVQASGGMGGIQAGREVYKGVRA